ncbi:fumarylacetoacetate hydrolase family protein [Pseudomonas sp. N040]|uniref:fumarylacetoacetate hydrolase family protein n=1 Tax=Pseudomonas sp. N040 TaxID=2785325 RepID=UPI0018A25B4A|nr:fumarylacetoacetate hydrolase family protein [Pseudomonas sp. N040]MBF7730475.1 fumarylacetoacetate hydrolase family protein [Pseudomonas sp. N040]MBW7014118.1 fumarylacetoacetate hydrolase family protein [Pseudomonas sp. N040]
MKKTFLVIAVLLLAWASAWQIADRPAPAGAPLFSERLQPQRLQTLAIAAPAEALTFARFLRDGEPHLLLVQRYAAGQVSGIDLQQALPGSANDPITLFNAQGYAALEQLRGAQTSVSADALLLPFDGTASQVAIGINYPEHGKEVALGDSFVFPKQTAATPHNASVPARDYLLDYEIELGFVTLEPLKRGTPPEYMGLVLASDYSDRAALMRHVNLMDVGSGAGFTQGKSEPGFMPVGNLLVIPRDYQAFYQTLQLELWCNGEKRQEANPARMTWGIQRILSETFAREGRTWQWNGQPVALPVDDGTIPPRTLFLSGTPAGVIYQKPALRQLFAGLSEAFFTLRWNQPQYIVEPFLRDAYRSGRFLQPGDTVVMRADRLGLISNRIVEQ